MLTDIDKDTIDWDPNFDETKKEPHMLPSRFPNLLVNGSQGIAVGMATNIAPHNLAEAIEATCYLIDNPDATVDELMQIMPGPDFPTGAIIMGSAGIKQSYETGRGSITVRAKAHVESTKTGRSRLVFTEIPYMVNKGTLQEKIAQLVNDKRIEGISDMRDESNQKGIRLVIELKKGVIPQVVLNNLYKYTSLQTTFGANNLALVNGVPKCLSLREMLQHYIDHQVDVAPRRTRFDLKKAQARAHILEGYLMALDHIDEVISIIRSSQTDSEASSRLIERFGFTPEQTTAILEMKLRRLTGLERDKIQEELDGLRRAIAYYEDLLAHEEKILGVIKDEMREILRAYPQYAEGGEERPAPVWHGVCAAILARTQWGVTDEAVLSAIACHTAGKPGMTRLDKILYLADMTSAERDWPGVEKLRKLEKKNLDAAMLAALKQTNDFVLSQGKPLDPMSKAAYEDILARSGKNER